MNGSEMFAKLQALRDQAGATHYVRVKMAQQLLKDRAWVRASDGGGGDEDIAIGRLEEMCFADLCGVVGLPALLDLLEHYPEQVDWFRHKFNLRKMWAEIKAKQPARKKTQAKPTFTRNGATTSTASNIEIEEDIPSTDLWDRLTYTQQRRKYQEATQLIAKLQTENKRLKTEIHNLKQAGQKLFAASA